MNCDRFETLLSDFMEGNLDSRVHGAMTSHLERCPACTELHQEVLQVREELRHFPEVALREELVQSILERTSGKPERYSLWNSFLLPALKPFLTERYAFATLMMFVIFSFAVNVMGPDFSVSSYSRLSPSALAARADQVSAEVYKKWHEFNDFKSRIAEEVRLFKEDLLGRLDYHLVTILFRSYDDALAESPAPEETGSQPEEPPSGREDTTHDE